MLSKEIIVLTSFIVIAVSIVYSKWRRRKDKIPQKWEPVGKVCGLYMYPLKGARRVELNTVESNKFGLQLLSNPQMQDRCMVAYKEENRKSITAITHQKLLLIETVPTENHFILKAPNMEPLELEIPSSEKNFRNTIFMMLDEPVNLLDCGDKAAIWISNCLIGKGNGLRIGYKDKEFNRNAKNHPMAKLFKTPNMVTTGIFADCGTVLLINKSSLDDLNSRIPNSDVNEHNFRPNIFIEGSDIKPYSEDDWDWVKIGDAIFRYQLVASRCSFATIHPENAKYAQHFEPIKTLRKYRPRSQHEKGSRSPNFGVYFSLISKGIIKVGDVVYLGQP